MNDYIESFGTIVNPLEALTWGSVEIEDEVVFEGSMPACERLVNDLKFCGTDNTENYR